MKYQDYLARNQSNKAYKLYHDHYDNTLYTMATLGKSLAYGNALTDAALALCGHPRHKLSYRHWGSDAIAFLERFLQSAD